MAQSDLFQDYSRLEHTNPDHKNYVVVNWCLGNICNFSCSYCPEGLHNSSQKWPKLEVVQSFCQKVIDHFHGRKVYFEFTGGEVTLWKPLIELAQFLKTQNAKVGLISNGTRDLKYWDQLIPHIDHVCLSFHPESAEKNHFFDVAKRCHSQIRTHVNLMMHPDHFTDCLELSYQVKDLTDVSIAIQPLMENMEDDLIPYTPTQQKVIDTQNAFLAKQIRYKNSFEYYRGSMTMVGLGKRKTMSPQRFISAEKNNWKGWYCSAGVEQIVVNMDGSVYRGWCRMGGSIGKITDSQLKLPKYPIVCGKNKCHCNLDIMSTKSKSAPDIATLLWNKTNGKRLQVWTQFEDLARKVVKANRKFFNG